MQRTLAERLAAIQRREDEMDDEEYLKTDQGKETLKILLEIISPRNGTAGVTVNENYNALNPSYKTLILSHLRKKLRMRQKLNKREENIAAALSKLL